MPAGVSSMSASDLNDADVIVGTMDGPGTEPAIPSGASGERHQWARIDPRRGLGRAG
jgi:hypothetical protein